jgi:hypothetical protein
MLVEMRDFSKNKTSFEITPAAEMKTGTQDKELES